MGLQFFSQRFLLVMVLLAGLVNAYLMRLCLNIAILKMVNEENVNVEMFQLTGSTMWDISKVHSVLDPEERFDWSEDTKGLIKSAFFIGYAIVHVPASFLGQKYGGKIILNVGLLLTALCTLLTPIVVKFGGADGLITLRFLMGVGEAPCYPALIYLLSCWIPMRERGRVSSIVFCGGQIGSIISNLMTGFVLHYIDGYATIFYIFGFIGIIWNILFHFLAYDTPQTHPRISDEEKKYLAEEVGNLVETRSFFQIPWTSMLSSAAVIVLIIAQMGHDWGFYILATEMPNYLRTVMNFNYEEIAIYTSVPYGFSYICSLISGIICDHIVTRKIVTLTRARQIFTAIGALVSAIFIIAISYAGYNRGAVVAFFILAMGAMGGFYTGAQANFLDLCPNYSGALMGLVNGAGAVCGFLVPYLNGKLTTNQSHSEWRKMFWVSFAVLSITLFTYLIWGSAEVQSWNDNAQDDWIKRLYRRYFARKAADPKKTSEETPKIDKNSEETTKSDKTPEETAKFNEVITE